MYTKEQNDFANMSDHVEVAKEKICRAMYNGEQNDFTVMSDTPEVECLPSGEQATIPNAIPEVVKRGPGGEIATEVCGTNTQ